MPTKYAEWVTQTCGCRWHLDIGTLLETDEANCTSDHTPKRCLECREMTDPDTIGHGSFGSGFHTVRFAE